jgi:sterol 3beta-glucosyltransferase
MKVLILTHGTRGDVQPFVALAQALNAAGHHSILSAPRRSAFLAEPLGIDFFPLYDRWAEVMRDPIVSAAFERNFRGLRGIRLGLKTMKKLRPMMVKALRDMGEARQHKPDLIVFHANIMGHQVAESLGVPAIPACVEPTSVPTRSFSNPMVPFRIPRLLNVHSYRATNIWVRGIVGDRNSSEWRSETLRLPPRYSHRDVLRRPDGTPAIVLQAFSELILPHPLDYPEWTHTTGFWFLPSHPTWKAPSTLLDFLANGDPPVYFGFGSLVGRDPEKTGKIIVDSISHSGVRALVDTAWGGIRTGVKSESILPVEKIPFDWLFSRTAGVVHHGGIGTTAMALASGRPQVVCPFMTTQHFFGHRMHEIGVAPPPLPQSRLSVRSLSHALSEIVTNTQMTTTAKEMGHRVRAEDGVRKAIKVLESIA